MCEIMCCFFTIILGLLEGPFCVQKTAPLSPTLAGLYRRSIMTKYDAALQEAELAFRPMTLIVWKAGILVVIRTENA